ncbi:glycosyltransferase family 2 protein [Pleionea mediterranea]|uniref:Cellulose synthase/poly-beta-1,6-N-acetylglucosamine synthase-like glycosyltransferase n=1 Tax=Pleionea mediterranea TaxID=523701 RepID=A0A316G1C5_9GAMM|nr:glycosyltransferase family 2 protein [Pleionea mediterranea]PWK53706.1 cellulose synthase/poly-beta-1,6-N-acetylglucosamine synthase-like glycosyltransferase [Pleionea mediterranea]
MWQEILFWCVMVGVTYSYFLYPLFLKLLPKARRITTVTPASVDSDLPSLSFIITAYNEQTGIADKLENTLLANYPEQQLEIIVASDGSTDNTNSIVEKYSSKGVKLVNVAEQKGKENAQKAAIGSAKGEVIVFSDVSTRIEPTGLLIIASAFQDKSIGALSSEDRFITKHGEVAGEGAYVKYEMWLRKQESQVKSLVGLSGSFFAARKQICNNWDISVPSDFNTALSCVEQGMAAVTVPNLLGFYPNISDESKEYQRKLRTVLRGMAALAVKRQVLNPFRFGVFSFLVISHKLMRWLVPVFLLLLIPLNMALLEQSVIYEIILMGQAVFYFIALTGWLSKSLRQNTVVKIIYFFTQVNLAIFHATIMFVRGKRITRWKPSQR